MGPNGMLQAQTSGEDLNDRLIESPKTRSYVPLLSKKANKTTHGSIDHAARDAHDQH